MLSDPERDRGLPLPVDLQGGTRRPMSYVSLLAPAPEDGRPAGGLRIGTCVMVGKGPFGSDTAAIRVSFWFSLPPPRLCIPSA